MCFALQSMGRTNHKLPIRATYNVETQLKSTLAQYEINFREIVTSNPP